MNNKINYQNIAYRITKGFLNRNSAEFYLQWENKINNITIDDKPIVDKIFILMCRNWKIGGILLELERRYNIKISKEDAYNILTTCQCFDIEITVMAKSFLYYELNSSGNIDDQIYYIQEHGCIDLPYTYEFSEDG